MFSNLRKSGGNVLLLRVHFYLALLSLLGSTISYSQDTTLYIINTKVGETISPDESKQFGLFLNFKGFVEARFYHILGDRYLAKVWYRPDSTETFEMKELSYSALYIKQISDRIDGIGSNDSKKLGADILFRVSKDLSGTHTISRSVDNIFKDNSKGLGASAELIVGLHSCLGVGIGYEVIDEREAKKWEGKFSFSSLYGIARLKLMKGESFPFLSLRLGSTSMSADGTYKGDGKVKGGSFHGYTVGYAHHIFFVQYDYSDHSGEWRLFSRPAEIRYKHVFVSTGLRISL